MQISSRRTSRVFCIVTLGLAAAFALFIVILNLRGISFYEVVPGNHVHTELGLYCPGCGGTRAFFATLRGDLLEALWLHPAVPIALIALLIFWVSHLLDLVTRGKMGALRVKPGYFYTLTAIILLQWIGKFVYLWVTGVKPI